MANLINIKTTINHYLEGLANGLTDGEPDKYIVNAGNLNCSFYLDKDNNPIFLKNENYKVSGSSNAGFTVTDDQGVNYIFNKIISASKSSGGSSDSYISSFLLIEINFPTTSNKIEFEYDPLPESYNDVSLTQTLTENSNLYVQALSKEILTNKTYMNIETNKLKKIKTNSFIIELQYSANPSEPAIAVISNLSIKDKLNNTVKSYDFTYSPWTGRRTNLLNVKYNGVITNEMEYYMPEPYPILSSDVDYTKKDLWGITIKKGFLLIMPVILLHMTTRL